jgi:hypothetical protein
MAAVISRSLANDMCRLLAQSGHLAAGRCLLRRKSWSARRAITQSAIVAGLRQTFDEFI